MAKVNNILTNQNMRLNFLAFYLKF